MKRDPLPFFLCLFLVSSPLLATVLQHEIGMRPRTVSNDSSQSDPQPLRSDERLFSDELNEQDSLDRLNLNYDPQKVDSGGQLAGGSYLYEVSVAQGELQQNGRQVRHQHDVHKDELTGLAMTEGITVTF